MLSGTVFHIERQHMRRNACQISTVCYVWSVLVCTNSNQPHAISIAINVFSDIWKYKTTNGKQLSIFTTESFTRDHNCTAITSLTRCIVPYNGSVPPKLCSMHQMNGWPKYDLSRKYCGLTSEYRSSTIILPWKHIHTTALMAISQAAN